MKHDNKTNKIDKRNISQLQPGSRLKDKFGRKLVVSDIFVPANNPSKKVPSSFRYERRKIVVFDGAGIMRLADVKRQYQMIG